MDNTGIKNIKYRVFIKGKGWSTWSKNGITSGNKKNDIQNIEIVVKLKNNEEMIDYYLYNNQNWINELDINKNLKNIKGIRLALMEKKLSNKYNICYRTHTKNSKWLKWSCDGQTNGIINENINAIEIKIIPKNVIKRDYLKDYEENNTLSGNY